MLFYWFSHLKWIQTCVKDTSNDWLDIKDLWSTQLCISLLQLDDFFSYAVIEQMLLYHCISDRLDQTLISPLTCSLWVLF